MEKISKNSKSYCGIEALYFEFKRLKLMIAAYFAFMAVESFVVLYLLAQTQLECNFFSYYQISVVPLAIGLSVGMQIVAGAITDRTASYQHLIVRFIAVSGAILDCVLFLFAREGPTYILVIFSLRTVLLLQTGYAIFKLMKMRIENVMKCPEDQQFRIFNNIVMVGQFGGTLISTLLAFVVPSVYLHYFNGQYYHIEYILFIGMFGADCLFTVNAMLIPQEYYVLPEGIAYSPIGSDRGSTLSDGKRDTEFPKELVDDINSHDGDVVENLSLSASGDDLQQINASIEIVSFDDDKIEPEDVDVPLQDDDLLTFWMKACKLYWTNGLLWGVMIKFSLYVASQGLVNTVLRFQVSGQNNQGYPYLDNMCAGYITNFIDITAITNSIQLGGNLVFQFVILKMRPWYFYNVVQNVIQLILCGLLLSLYFDLSTALNGAVLALIMLIQYFVTNFDNNVINAITPNEIMGLSFALQGSVAPLLQLFAVWLAATSLTSWVNTTIILGFNGLVLGFSIFVGIYNSGQMKSLLDDNEEFDDEPDLDLAASGEEMEGGARPKPGAWKRVGYYYKAFVLGYGPYWKEAKKEE